MVYAFSSYTDGNLQLFGNVQSVVLDGECTGNDCQTEEGVTTPSPPRPPGPGRWIVTIWKIMKSLCWYFSSILDAPVGETHLAGTSTLLKLLEARMQTLERLGGRLASPDPRPRHLPAYSVGALSSMIDGFSVQHTVAQGKSSWSGCRFLHKIVIPSSFTVLHMLGLAWSAEAARVETALSSEPRGKHSLTFLTS